MCDPIVGSPPGSPVPGILHARTLEWAAISFSNAWKWKVKVKSLSKCPTLSDPMDCSLPVSSVHGIFPGKSTGAGCHCLLHHWYRCYVNGDQNYMPLEIPTQHSQLFSNTILHCCFRGWATNEKYQKEKLICIFRNDFLWNPPLFKSHSTFV